MIEFYPIPSIVSDYPDITYVVSPFDRPMDLPYITYEDHTITLFIHYSHLTVPQFCVDSIYTSLFVYLLSHSSYPFFIPESLPVPSFQLEPLFEICEVVEVSDTDFVFRLSDSSGIWKLLFNRSKFDSLTLHQQYESYVRLRKDLNLTHLCPI